MGCQPLSPGVLSPAPIGHSGPCVPCFLPGLVWYHAKRQSLGTSDGGACLSWGGLGWLRAPVKMWGP